MDVIQQTKSLVNDLGWLNTPLYLGDRLLNRISKNISLRRYYLVAQPVPVKALLPKGKGRNITILEIKKDDPLLDFIFRPNDEIERRYEQNAICFGALKNDKLIGYIWLITSGSYREPVDRCILTPLPEGQASWDLDIYIDPAERFGFTFSRLWDEANKYLRKKGITWTVSRISAYNPASIRSHGQLGANFLHSTTFLSIGEFQVMLTDIAPYIHISLYKEAAPRIDIETQSLARLREHS